jgi:hypothetical protein
MARLPCTKPGASSAVGPRWLPARIASRVACPLLVASSRRIHWPWAGSDPGKSRVASAASAAGYASGACSFRGQHIRPCEYVCINACGLKLTPGSRLLKRADCSARACQGPQREDPSMPAHAALRAHGVPMSAAVLCIARHVRMTPSTDRLHTWLSRMPPAQ